MVLISNFFVYDDSCLMRMIKSVQKVIDAFESLPGIGPKSASRLAYYLLNVPQDRLEKFGDSLVRLKKETKVCRECFNVGEDELCAICDDEGRDKSIVCVVETALDLLAFEKADGYEGVYHVLGGVVNPLMGIGPDDLRIPQLLNRVSKGGIKEIILGMNPTMEGEATAMHIANEVREIDSSIVVTRIGRGLQTGADVEYADGQTLSRALEGRRAM